jgi:hypothetical protein
MYNYNVGNGVTVPVTFPKCTLYLIGLPNTKK